VDVNSNRKHSSLLRLTNNIIVQIHGDYQAETTPRHSAE